MKIPRKREDKNDPIGLGGLIQLVLTSDPTPVAVSFLADFSIFFG
jgi:hypothetical protein